MVPAPHALRAKAQGIDGVRVQPFVQAPELPAYYAAADVFVFPTLGDPHGQVVEEAHAAGLPIIASNAAGDIERRVIDGANGFVVPAGDVTCAGAQNDRARRRAGSEARDGHAGRRARTSLGS